MSKFFATLIAVLMSAQMFAQEPVNLWKKAPGNLPLQVTQVVGMPNRGGSNPDGPNLLMQLGDLGRGEYLPLVFGSLSCADPYPPAYFFGNQNYRFSELLQLQNGSGDAWITQQIFDFQSTVDTDLDGWNVFSAYWYQVGGFCDAVVISVTGQSPTNPIADMKSATCSAFKNTACTTPDFSTPTAPKLVLAIGVAVGPDGNPTHGFVSPGDGCSIVGGEISSLGTIVEICGTQKNASANFGAAGGRGILTAIALQ